MASNFSSFVDDDAVMSKSNLVMEEVQEGDINQTTSWLGIFLRCLIASIGILLGIGTFVPNIMMSDSGKPSAVMGAKIGMLASLAFIVGGVVGAIRGEWKWLVVGLLLQILAFLVAF
jgi:hypothetical protein